MSAITVWAVSWVNWTHGEQTSGGFDWFRDRDAARRAFHNETGRTAAGRIRLVEVTLPDGAEGRITEHIDANLDALEDAAAMRDVGWTCLAVALRVPEGCDHGPRAVATCGDCHRSWCDSCDPGPSALCPWCHGRGYSTAPRVSD